MAVVRTLTCRDFVIISSGFGRLFAMCFLRFPKHSGGPLQWGRITFSIEIYRLEEETNWTLEVVGYEGSSHVWDDQFASDKDARNEGVKELETEGSIAIMRGNNVIPFP